MIHGVLFFSSGHIVRQSGQIHELLRHLSQAIIFTNATMFQFSETKKKQKT